MRKIIFFLITVGVVITGSCNQTSQESTAIPNTKIKEEKTSYDIKHFMSFDKHTTYKDVIKYFEEINNKYIENPDLSNPKYYDENGKPQLILLDCKYAKFLWIPELKFDELIFKNVLFSFLNNTLSSISIYKVGNTPNIEIQRLEMLYKTKYGEGEKTETTDTLKYLYFTWKDLQSKKVYTDVANTLQQKRVIHTYNNYNDSNSVIFYHSYKLYHTDNDLISVIREGVNITFSSYEILLSKCLSLRSQIEEKEKEKKKKKEEKLLENL